MFAFRHSTIRAKLITLTMLTSTVGLLVFFALFVVNDFVFFRRSMVRDLAALAEIIGANSSAALDFEDEEQATKTLAALKARPHLLSAAIYTKEGKILGRYFRDNDKVGKSPSTPGSPGHVFSKSGLVLFQPIYRGGERLGTIYLHSDMEEMYSRLWRYVGIGMAILVGALGVAFIISSQLQRKISGPILDLAQTAGTVSKEKNYSVRAVKRTEDEVGFLIDRFNEMLSQIEKRERELRDVNDQLVESEKRATAATRAKSQFLANMSHELRTPLNAIIGYSEMLQEEAAELDQKEFIPDLQKVQAAGKHLLSLINDILDLSKVEAGKMMLYLETFDIAIAVNDVVATIRPLLDKNSNKLELECRPDIGAMRADLTKVRQALFNLLSNACKFTEKGTIKLQAERRSQGGRDFIFLQVSDTGIGMTPQQLGHIFEAFSQADSSTTRKFGGTGLGLAISRKFCQMMGGELSVVSQPRKGSTFTVALPSVVEEPKADPATAAAQPRPQSPDAALVLVIDDDPVARELLQRSLSKEGFRVQFATGGQQGLEMAQRLKPAVITLDVMMPDLDGWAVLSALRANPELADIPVIIITIVDDKNVGFAIGATEYLTKPINWDRLSAILRKYRHESGARPILVVEDDAAMREVLQRNLRKANCSVVTAENGRVALELMETSTPSLILLDLMMPHMDGFEFITELRKNPKWHSIPIVVITAKDLTVEDRLRLNGFVAKILEKGAVSRDVLLAEVRELVAASVERQSRDAANQAAQPAH